MKTPVDASRRIRTHDVAGTKPCVHPIDAGGHGSAKLKIGTESRILKVVLKGKAPP